MSKSSNNKSALYGLMIEFNSPRALVAATQRAHDEGYRKMDAYSPFPVEGLADTVHVHRNRLPKLVLVGGIVGGLIGFFMQYYAAVISYPMNVGGRPLNSWPSFIPITFEVTILIAAFTVVLGMLGLNGLPMPYHPVFNAPRFALASHDRFFLCIESVDPKFDLSRTKQFLQSLGGHDIVEVLS